MIRRLLTVAEAAAYCGLTEKALRHRVDRRAIPFKRLGPRTLRFDPRALDAWMSEWTRYIDRRRPERTRGGAR
jgi:excisionase family DNA binding protein